MIKRLEDHLLNTGKYRRVLGPWFRLRYSRDIRLLMQYYSNWQVIHEGFEAYEVYKVFLRAYNWSFTRYLRITRACFYLGKLELLHHHTASRPLGFTSVILVRSYFTIRLQSSCEKSATGRKEAQHA